MPPTTPSTRRSASRSAPRRWRGWRGGWASGRRSRGTGRWTLGGLKQGVTPLDMAHAYQTFARQGKLVYGSMSPGALRKRPAGARPRRDPLGSRAARTARLKPVTLPNGEQGAQPRPHEAGARRGRRRTPSRRSSRASSRAAPASARRWGIVPVAGKTGTTRTSGTRGSWAGRPTTPSPCGSATPTVGADEDRVPGPGGRRRHLPAGIFKTFMEAVLKIDPPTEVKEGRRPGATARAPPRCPAHAAPAPASPPDTEPAPATAAAETEPRRSRNPPAPQKPRTSRPPSSRPRRPRRRDNGGTAPSGGRHRPPAAGRRPPRHEEKPGGGPTHLVHHTPTAVPALSPARAARPCRAAPAATAARPSANPRRRSATAARPPW